MVTILNEEGEVIGSMDRAEARAKGAVRSIAAVIIFNSKGNIILQRISKNKSHCPLKLTYSAAGHIDAGEDLKTAAKRELKEELGIEAELDGFIGIVNTQSFTTGKTNGFHHVFKAVHDGPYYPDFAEIEELVELTEQEARGMIKDFPDNFEPGAAKIISNMLNK